MLQKTHEVASDTARDILVAYLSYAVEDVGAISPIAVHLLQLAIAAISRLPDTDDAMGNLQ